MQLFNIRYWNIDYQKDMSENSIRQAEQAIGYGFPEDYKQFLLRYKGKVYLNINTIIVSDDDYGDEECSVVSLEDTNSILKSWEFIKDYEVLEGMIPIGSTLGSSFWGMDLNDENFGAIYLIEADLTTTFVAASFVAFLEQIDFSNDIPVEFSVN